MKEHPEFKTTIEKMPEELPNLTHLSEPTDVVQTWQDVILYTDASGLVLKNNNIKIKYLPKIHALGIPFWEVLGLGTDSLKSTLKTFPQFDIHEISCDQDHSYLLRIIPLCSEISENEGFIIIATDNRSMADLFKYYRERLFDNINAWSDSITMFNALFDTAKDATFLIDDSGTVVAANPAAGKQHGHEGQALVGTDFEELFNRRYRKSIRNAMEELNQGQIWCENIVAYDSERETFPCEATLRKISFTGYSLYQLILHDLSRHVELKENLRDKKAEVERMNIALRQVIKTVEEDRQEFRENLTNQVKKQMLPALDHLARAEEAEVREGYKTVIEEQLAELAGDHNGETDASLLRLSAREMEVCRLVQLGKVGKEIAEILSMSFETVQTHRKNIRKKLGLRGKKISLYTFLRQKPPLN